MVGFLQEPQKQLHLKFLRRRNLSLVKLEEADRRPFKPNIESGSELETLPQALVLRIFLHPEKLAES